MSEAKALEAAGAFAVLIEMVPENVRGRRGGGDVLGTGAHLLTRTNS
ncbi:hypothetical protein [Streptomyces sp. NPDC030920]